MGKNLGFGTGILVSLFDGICDEMFYIESSRILKLKGNENEVETQNNG
jgi:hypothetical protein